MCYSSRNPASSPPPLTPRPATSKRKQKSLFSPSTAINFQLDYEPLIENPLFACATSAITSHLDVPSLSISSRSRSAPRHDRGLADSVHAATRDESRVFVLRGPGDLHRPLLCWQTGAGPRQDPLHRLLLALLHQTHRPGGLGSEIRQMGR